VKAFVVLERDATEVELDLLGRLLDDAGEQRVIQRCLAR
jgi:hypothetical protein